MRTPDAALIRARAKAPLRDLQALHLSGAGVEGVRHLELCRDALRSLYADANRLRDLEGLLALRRLWRVDLNDNALHRGLYKNQKASLLAPLASFAALGFLYLERNQLRFDDLVCLRDAHVMELRLQGNLALLQGGGSNDVIECRKKIVALLPNVWILDGHYVASAERERAIDEHDAFVQYLLANERDIGAGGVCGKFGSTAELWGGVVSEDCDGGMHEQNENAAKLIEHIHTQRVCSAELMDRHRLHTVVALHNEECAVHNRHCKFAPSKFSPNARAMPKIPLQELLALPRQIRLEVAATLATYLEFGFGRVLLIEALTIQLLGCEGMRTDAAEELASLPSYALTAILCIMRHHALEQEEMVTQYKDSELEHERMLWTSMPPLFTTLLGFDKDVRHSPERTEQSFAMRCHFVVRLLSRAVSFPDDMLEYRSDRKSGKDASGLKCLAELLPLVQISKLVANNNSYSSDDNEDYAARSDGTTPVFIMGPWISSSGGGEATDQQEKKINRLPWKSKLPSRDYLRPWGETALSTSISTSALDFEHPGSSDTSRQQQKSVKRRPRAGEWLEIRPKQFLKIRELSEDGSHVIAFQSTESSAPLVIHVDQLTRVSSNMWRVTESGVSQQLAEKNLRIPSSLGSGKLGKLHRDSEGFHRHGAARSQGFPNHTVTNEDLQELERIQADNEQTQPAPTDQLAQSVALFCSNDTIDSNFVLAPPQLVSAQNYCAIKHFQELGQSPAGLWSPIKQTSFAMLPATNSSSASQSQSMKRASSNGSLLADVKVSKGREPPPQPSTHPDMLETESDAILRRREV
ncbi:hypothetical protein Gpo141_00005843 [Globisporangium polare]